MKKQTTREIFSQMLVKLRKNKDISRNKLAEVLGVSVASIGYYETGKRVPDIETLVKMADYFGVTCDEMLKGVKSPDKNIYKDLWISDNALNTLRALKETEPINDETQISYLFEFFNEILENPNFIYFISNYYQYAIGYNGLCAFTINAEIDENFGIILGEFIDAIDSGTHIGSSFYEDFKLFETIEWLKRLIPYDNWYKNLRNYEYFRVEKLEQALKNKDIAQKINEAYKNGNNNPKEE